MLKGPIKVLLESFLFTKTNGFPQLIRYKNLQHINVGLSIRKNLKEVKKQYFPRTLSTDAVALGILK